MIVLVLHFFPAAGAVAGAGVALAGTLGTTKQVASSTPAAIP
ncbi:hypothetical protein ACXC9Q_11445 [Kribbella sp. CWNU-51]